MFLALFCGISAVLSVMWCICQGDWLWRLPVGFVGLFLAQFLVVFAATWVLTLFIDLEKEQETDSKFHRWLVNELIRLLIPFLGVDIRTKGLEHTPKEGRFLLVCNHLFDFDPPLLLHCFRKSQLAFISKRENSTMFLVGKLMHKLLCQLINRENDREALKTIMKCIQILKDDKASIAVFPEGYTSRDHKFHGFRAGVFKIAQKAQVPIVVCTITNTHKVLPNLFKLKRTTVDLHLVAVIHPEEFAGQTTVALGNRIHDLMATDLGPEYAPDEN
jgi:1-acyl-sn-glycerol-3-phosphate acyltransferase